MLMPTTRLWRATRRGCITSALIVACLPPVLAAQSTSFPNEQKRQGIDHHNRMLLVRAKATGKTNGVVLLATTHGSIGAVADSITRLGGKVLVRFDEIGYLRIMLPLSHFARVVAMPTIVDARIDAGNQGYSADLGTQASANRQPSRQPEPMKGVEKLPPIPAEALAESSPYVPMSDMRVPQFRSANPTFDGRGITIAIVEGGTIDFKHPALQKALSLKGDPLPKVRGVIVPGSFALPPTADSTVLQDPEEAYHIRMRVRPTGPVDAARGSIAIDGVSYLAPSGVYSVGTATPRLGFGTHGSSTPTYGVIWDTSRSLVWVDTNRNRDFRDEAPLQDINKAFSTGWLRRDSTAESDQPSLSLAVMFDSAGGGVHVFNGTYVHQTMVASVAAGHNLAGGAASGAAPNAQVILVSTRGAPSDMIEGFVRALRDPRVDLATASMGTGNFPEAGLSIVATILNRAIQVYGKPIFRSAGNAGPVMMTNGETGNGTNVIAVGASVSAATFKAHHGWNVPDTQDLTLFSSRGPTADGALKPDLAAPTWGLSAKGCSSVRGEPGDPTQYRMPPCYWLSGGTSSASPTAAGAGAVLLSAAKQRGLTVDGIRLKWAMTTGAQYLPNRQAYEQGGGIVNVERAWQLLQLKVDLPTIVTQAPVSMALNRYLRTPGIGRGLYEREGWKPGQRGSRSIMLTRTAGGRERYAVRWLGNDGSFSTRLKEVALPLDKSVAVPVTIEVKEAGVHSATLELVDPVHKVAVHRVLMTVVAAEQFDATNGYEIRRTVRTPWPNAHSMFVRVPEGTAAMRVNMRVIRGKIGLRAEDGGAGSKLHNDPNTSAYISAGKSGEHVMREPAAGVWELCFRPEDRPTIGDSAQYQIPGEVEVTVTMLGAEAHATEVGAVTFQKHLVAPQSTHIVAEAGARRIASETIDTANGPIIRPLTIASGTTSLRVQVAAADTTSSLDLYLYDCTTGTCYLSDMVRNANASSGIVVRTPAVGTWKVVVDPARIVGGRGSYAYTEVVTGVQFGRATVTPDGSGWSARIAIDSAADVTTLAGRESVVVAELIEGTASSGTATQGGAGQGSRKVVLATAVVRAR
jgi:hypothetical protein